MTETYARSPKSGMLVPVEQVLKEEREMREMLKRQILVRRILKITGFIVFWVILMPC